ncbi:hypothetical protein C0989_012356 [Termitomyces sp. Mn162]|nr:hypothetical protein C0989_012356 [Termitomyces sp. Mn162]
MSAFGTNNAGISASSSTGSFGAAKPATGGGLFGAPAASTTPATTGGTFGNPAGAAPTGTTGTSTPSTSLFGGGSTSNTTIPAASTNIFGSKPPAPSPTTSIGASAFGATSTTNIGAASINPFGTSSTTTPASHTSATTSANPLLSGFPKPADTSATNTAKVPGSGLFGQSSTSAATTAAANAPSAGSFFSQPVKPDAASSTTAAASSSNNLFGGAASAVPAKDFFSKPPEQQKDGASAAAPAIGGLFGAKPADPKDAPATSTTSLGGSFFGKPVEKKDGSAPTSATPATSTTASSGQTSTSLSVAVAPPSTLKGKSIEEIVNKWSTDLETHVREFNKFATEVAVWDRTLIDNSNTESLIQLNTLYSHVEAAEREQNDIDQSLDHIEQQQNELVSTLAAYEKVAQEILGSQGGSMRALDTGPADTERDKNYMLAADLHTHLDDLSGSLTQMIDSVNSLSLPSIDSSPAEDPMAQIAQILSSHLESLQWIDGAVHDVESKIIEVEQRVKENGHTLPSSGQKSSGRTFGLTR